MSDAIFADTADTKMSHYSKQTEVKHVDQSTTSLGYGAACSLKNISSTRDYYRLEKIAEGDDFNNRDGRKIFIRRLEIDGWMRVGISEPTNGAAGEANNICTVRVTIARVTADWITNNVGSYTVSYRLFDSSDNRAEGLDKVYLDERFVLSRGAQPLSKFPRWVDINSYWQYDDSGEEDGTRMLICLFVSDQNEDPITDDPGLVNNWSGVIRVYFNDC